MFAAKEPAWLASTRPICQPAEAGRRGGGVTGLSSALQLPLISPFFGPFIPLCIRPVISIPVRSHSSSAPQLHEPSFLSGPEQTRKTGALS